MNLKLFNKQHITKNEQQMYTYNITFVMSPHVEEDFKSWLKSEAISANLTLLTSRSRLQKVVEIGGEKPGSDHGLSIALQIDFQSKEEADKWNTAALPTLLRQFMEKFGPSTAYFTTLLETTTFL